MFIAEKSVRMASPHLYGLFYTKYRTHYLSCGCHKKIGILKDVVLPQSTLEYQQH